MSGKLIIPVLLSTLVFLGLACGGKKQLSNNIVDVQSRYPEGLYVLRKAGGSSESGAADAARLEIVKFFEASISGQTRVLQWGRSETRRGRIITSQVTDLLSDIQVSGERDIPGIEIVGSRKMPNGDYEVWAALSKINYADYLKNEISGIDALIGELLATHPDTDLIAARNLAKSAAMLLQREEKRADLVVMNRAADVPSLNKRYAAVMTSLDSVITRRLDVGIVIGGDAGDAVGNGIVAGISDAGIRCTRYSSLSEAVSGASDVLVNVTVSVTERTAETTIQSRQQKLYWADWIMSLNALDPATKGIIDATVLSGKSSGLDPGQARTRMEYALLQERMSAVTAWIYALIFG